MALPIGAKAALLWRLARDPDVPLLARLLLPAVLIYLALPFDLRPDRIPIVGQLDDLIVIALGIGVFVLLTPNDVLESHLAALE